MSVKSLAKSCFQKGKSKNCRYLIHLENRAERRIVKQKIHQIDPFYSQEWEEDLRVEKDPDLLDRYYDSPREIDRLLISNVGQKFDDVYGRICRLFDDRKHSGRRVRRIVKYCADRNFYSGYHHSSPPSEPEGEPFVNEEGVICFHPRPKKVPWVVKLSKKEIRKLLSFLKNRRILISGSKLFWALPSKSVQAEVQTGHWHQILSFLVWIDHFSFSAPENKWSSKLVLVPSVEVIIDRNQRKPHVPWNFVSWREDQELSKQEVKFFFSLPKNIRKSILKKDK